MPVVPIGVDAGVGRNTDDEPVYSDGVGLPTGRICANGAYCAAIVELRAWVTGYGSARLVRFRLGGASTAVFEVGPAADAYLQDWHPTNLWIVYGGSTRFQIDHSGRIYFKGGGPGDTYDAEGYRWNGTLAGFYRYHQPPVAPGKLDFTPQGPGKLGIHINPTGDDGEATVVGYNLQRALDRQFTKEVVTTSVPASGDVALTGLEDKPYWWRATCRNAVTDAATVLGGQWSEAVQQGAPPIDASGGLGQIGKGSSFVAADGRRFREGAWQPMQGRRYREGSWGPIS